MSENIDSKELDNFIELLQSARDNNTIESYIYIKNILNSVEFPIPFAIYPKGSKFVRSRIHRNNETFFKKIKDISYRTDIQNIKSFGRASEPGQSIFYCADDDWLAYAETSPIVRKQEEKTFEYITTGLWISTEDIFAVSLLTNDNIRGQHTGIDNLSKSFENLIENQADENAYVVSQLFQFLSKEFSKLANDNSNNYKITAAFANYIFDSVEQADCILYPSTIYPIKGFNFAFEPKTVENKMVFHSAIRRKMEKFDNTNYAETELIESLSNENNKVDIIWK